MPEERRVVTVLFADVTGSTSLGEDTDPEELRALMGRYYAIAREVIAGHGGTLEKFIGDAVMAVFGLPQAHGDDADRALAAAVALRDGLARDPATSSLGVRIGVNTGEVVATRERDAGDFLITGDAVNVAARLEQHAEPGTILVGERTRAAAGASFSFGDAVAIEAKGKREPLRAATLRERTTDHRAPLAPFVGREADLAQLALVAARAFKEKRPQLVTITAPAGTGKSRLVDEFASRLEGATVATAQCLPYGSSVTYLPLRGLAHATLGAASDGEIVARARETFLAAGHAAADADRLSGFIGATLGGAEAAESDREQLFNAWRLLVEALAARGPLVVVFEDLHWASDSLIDLVEHVTHPRTSAPLVMVALARPELVDRRPTWGGGRKNFTAIGLEPLDDGETRHLVGLMTEGIPGEMARRIAERAGGNPFFAGELVRSYEQRKRAGTADADIVLPDTVHATVLARLDGLPRDRRDVLEYAAVAGRTARTATIAALLPGRGERSVTEACEALAEQDLLVPQGGGAYTFRHIVIREVAYATLPRAERVTAHLRAASWLEAEGAARGEELGELVAYHYRQALALTPGGRLPEGLQVASVVAAFERAARVAWRGGAYGEAVAQVREAIRISPPEEHLRLLELIGDVVRYGDEGVNGYREAYERWRASADGDPAVGARLLVKRLEVLGRWQGSLTRPAGQAEFEALVSEASALLARAPDPVLEAKLACSRAFIAMRWAETTSVELIERLRDGAQKALEFFERREPDAMSEALDALGSLYRYGLGDRSRAIDCDRARLAMADRLGLLERLDAWSVLCWDLVLDGRYAEAIDTFEQARRTLRAGESESNLNHAATWAAYGAYLSGAWDEALRIGDLLLAMREENPDSARRYTTRAWLGLIRVARAREDETRLARYRAVLDAVAEVGSLPPGDRYALRLDAILRGDERFFREPAAGSQMEATAEVISAFVFEHGNPVPEDMLRAYEALPTVLPSLLTIRIQLARAAAAGTADVLRRAVAALDEGDLVADAARAATLVALRTRDASDRADAERRLTALGDRVYLAKLREG